MSLGPQLNERPLKVMMLSRLPLACLMFWLLLLAACETLDNRLARNQALLNTSSAEHQDLIRQGRIEVGFTPTEVYLAWGAPSHKAFTEDARGREETWLYTLTQTETSYREERYYDRGLDLWRSLDYPYQRSRELIFQEARFENGLLSSFTIYPTFKPYHRDRSWR